MVKKLFHNGCNVVIVETSNCADKSNILILKVENLLKYFVLINNLFIYGHAMQHMGS